MLNRKIKSEVEFNRCPCGAVATSACTDAVEKQPGVWAESEPRLGCRAHPALPMILFLNGKIVDAEKYKRVN